MLSEHLITALLCRYGEAIIFTCYHISSFVHPFLYPSVHLSIYSSVFPSFFLSIRLFIQFSIYPSFVHLMLKLFRHLFILSFLPVHTVTIALHRDCGVTDQLRAALVVEILNYMIKYNDFAPVGCFSSVHEC